MRSQYCANQKAVLPLSEVAARMGHTPNSRVTMASYGPRSAAHGRQGAQKPVERCDDRATNSGRDGAPKQDVPKG